MLSADLDSEIQACLMGARRMGGLFERFGKEQVEACFQTSLTSVATSTATNCSQRLPMANMPGKITSSTTVITDPKLHRLR